MEDPRFIQQAGEVAAGLKLVGERRFDEAEALLTGGLAKVAGSGFRTERALFQSALGFLEKVRGRLKEAWRWYDGAEKTLPDDPALKIISARFLVEQFAQPDAAIKRAKRVLKIAAQSRPFIHHALVTMGLAYLTKGNRKEAAAMLDRAMEDDFAGIVDAANIDLHLIEAFIRRDMEIDRCRLFLEKAKGFAARTGNQAALKIFDTLLGSFEVTAAG